MAPKSKSKKKSITSKKEVLEDPVNVKNGTANHYIGGWSSLAAFADITEISHEVVAAHTAEDRTVAPLPRTNVLLLPTNGAGSGGDGMDAGDVDLAEEAPDQVEVADNMHIEGLSCKTVREKAANVKSWERPLPEPVTVSTEETTGTAVAARMEGEKAEVAPDAAGTEEDAAPSASPQDEAADTAVHAGMVEALPEPATQATPFHPLEDVSTMIGANFAASDVQLTGPIDLVGMQPQVVVKPNLPAPTKKTEDDADASKKARKKSSASSSRRKSAKQKLTPEQLAELEQKRAEEEALFLKATEEAVALAAAQEDYLMTFAHPDRWPRVTITNVTFAGPVVVRRAHIVFQNCRFTARGGGKPQLTVSQYCRVQCVKCTFDAPARCGLYLLPTADVSVKKCLFTGIPQARVVGQGSEGERQLYGGVTPAPLNAKVSGEDTDEQAENDVAGEAGAADAAGTDAAATGEALLTPALQAASDEARASRPASTGAHADCAKLVLDDCRFFFLGTGVALRGRYAFAPVNAAHTRSAKKLPMTLAAASMVVQSCQFMVLYNTALVLEAHDVLLRRNTVSDCEYYGLDCRGASCRNVSVQENTFGVHAVVRLRERAQAALLGNQFHSVPVDDNSLENPCMEAVY